MEYLLHAAITHLLQLAGPNQWRLLYSSTDGPGKAVMEFELPQGMRDANWKPNTSEPTEYKHVRFTIQVTE